LHVIDRDAARTEIPRQTARKACDRAFG
jgi:hypothetical protein